MSFHFVQTRVDIVLAGATWPDADALLVPSNDYLWMASGSALEVKKVAGDDVEMAAVRLGPIALGEVVSTDAGKLQFQGILHAAIMGQNLHPDPEATGRAMKKALQICGERRWKRLLIHSFLGAGRRGGGEILRSAVDSLVEALLDGSSLQQVTFLAADEGERSILHETLLRTIQKQG